MALRRAHVLPERNDVDANGAERVERGLQLGLGFAQAEHDACFRDEGGVAGFGMREDGEALLEGGTAVADLRGEGFDSLDVVRVDV